MGDAPKWRSIARLQVRRLRLLAHHELARLRGVAEIGFKVKYASFTTSRKRLAILTVDFDTSGRKVACTVMMPAEETRFGLYEAA